MSDRDYYSSPRVKKVNLSLMWMKQSASGARAKGLDLTRAYHFKKVVAALLLCSLTACSIEDSGVRPETPKVISTAFGRSRASNIYTRVHRRPGRLGPSGGKLGLQDRFEYPQVPRVYHPEVKKFVELYTTSRRSYITEALGRRARLLPTIEPILARYGLPKEIANIAFIESRFQPSARYKDGSTIGLWQLSRDTARNYGLRVEKGRDERLDVTKSTEAAARFLASLYDSFGDWYLAAAAYNAGPVRVQKALDAAGESVDVHRLDFFGLTARGILSPITREFVAKLGALTLIQDDFRNFGFADAEREQISKGEKR